MSIVLGFSALVYFLGRPGAGPERALGAPCETTLECAEPLLCVRRVCARTPQREGQECSVAADCEFGFTCAAERCAPDEDAEPEGVEQTP